MVSNVLQKHCSANIYILSGIQVAPGGRDSLTETKTPLDAYIIAFYTIVVPSKDLL